MKGGTPSLTGGVFSKFSCEGRVILSEWFGCLCETLIFYRNYPSYTCLSVSMYHTQRLFPCGHVTNNTSLWIIPIPGSQKLRFMPKQVNFIAHKRNDSSSGAKGMTLRSPACPAPAVQWSALAWAQRSLCCICVSSWPFPPLIRSVSRESLLSLKPSSSMVHLSGSH